MRCRTAYRASATSSDEAGRRRFEEVWGVPVPPQPGWHLSEMFEAMEDRRLRSLYVVGENPADSEADVAHARRVLADLEFLVVQDIFLTATARMADVVLPAAASFAETTGTVTSSERRVQLVRAAVSPPGEARDDLAIVFALARELGHDWGEPDAEAVWDELRSLSRFHAGMAYSRLDALGGLRWPCPDEQHPGSQFLHGRLWADPLEGPPVPFVPVQWEAPLDDLDEEYPIRLTTGRRLDSFNTGVQSGSFASPLRRPEELDVCAADARRLGIAEGEVVRVVSRRGAVEAPVRFDRRPGRGPGVPDVPLPRSGRHEPARTRRLGSPLGDRRASRRRRYASSLSPADGPPPGGRHSPVGVVLRRILRCGLRFVLGCGLRPLRGQGDGHLGELTGGGVHTDGAAVLADDVVGDRQAQPRSLIGGLRGEERVEDLVHHVGGDAVAVVADLDLDARRGSCGWWCGPWACRSEPSPASTNLLRFPSVAWQLLPTMLMNTLPRSCGSTSSSPTSGSRSNSRFSLEVRIDGAGAVECQPGVLLDEPVDVGEPPLAGLTAHHQHVVHDGVGAGAVRADALEVLGEVGGDVAE